MQVQRWHRDFEWVEEKEPLGPLAAGQDAEAVTYDGERAVGDRVEDRGQAADQWSARERGGERERGGGESDELRLADDGEAAGTRTRTHTKHTHTHTHTYTHTHTHTYTHT
jgi:hypothetical protein